MTSLNEIRDLAERALMEAAAAAKSAADAAERLALARLTLKLCDLVEAQHKALGAASALGGYGPEYGYDFLLGTRANNMQKEVLEVFHTCRAAYQKAEALNISIPDPESHSEKERAVKEILNVIGRGEK